MGTEVIQLALPEGWTGAGATVSWHMQNEEDVDREELFSAIKTATLIELQPAQIGPAAALQRVLKREFGNSRTLIKPMASRRSKEPRYAVMPEEDQGDRPAFFTAWDVGITRDAAGDPGLDFSQSSDPRNIEVTQLNFGVALNTMSRTELSVYLTQLVTQVLRGIPIIGGNGSYFIAPTEVNRWRALKAVFVKYGIRLYEVPTMRCDQAIEWLRDSITAYVRKATGEIGEAMDDARKKNNDPAYKGQPGRTLATQQIKAQEQLDLVSRYEAVLGTTLDELREEISKLNWNITVADVGGM